MCRGELTEEVSTRRAILVGDRFGASVGVLEHQGPGGIAGAVTAGSQTQGFEELFFSAFIFCHKYCQVFLLALYYMGKETL
jgi:hypothetical protein